MFKIFRNKTVFVTGHTGFKGSWLCLILNYLGANVVGYSLAPPTKPSLYEILKIDELLRGSYIADIRDYETLYTALKKTQPDIVIHMAAQALVRLSYDIPIDTYGINVMGTVNLLNAVRNFDSIKAVLNVTTDKCYENKEWLWSYRENEPMGGYDPYSSSKACSELVTSSFRSSFFNPQDYKVKHNIALASARAGNVIGGGDWAKDRLIPDFVRSITGGKDIKIRNPFSIRPWQHVFEPLNGYLYLCAKLYQEGIDYAQGWNFGPDEDDVKNVEWIIQTMCNLWGGVNYEVEKGLHPHEANYLKLDCSKAKTLLGWKPKWKLLKALDSIVDWNKAFINKENMREFSLKQIKDYLNT